MLLQAGIIINSCKNKTKYQHFRISIPPLNLIQFYYHSQTKKKPIYERINASKNGSRIYYKDGTLAFIVQSFIINF